LSAQHLLFIRHGETLANEQQLAYGVTESPLNEKGIAQAQALGQCLQSWPTPYHRILSSPLERARHTAELVNRSLNLDIEIDPGLIECDLGDWEGITYQQMHDFGYAMRSIKDDTFAGHGGESPDAVYDRVDAALTRACAQYPDQNLIIVSHGSAIAHGLAAILQTRPKFGYQYLMHNGAITEVVLEAAPRLLTLNNYEHLPAALRAESGRPDNAQQA